MWMNAYWDLLGVIRMLPVTTQKEDSIVHVLMDSLLLTKAKRVTVSSVQLLSVSVPPATTQVVLIDNI